MNEAGTTHNRNNSAKYFVYLQRQGTYSWDWSLGVWPFFNSVYCHWNTQETQGMTRKSQNWANQWLDCSNTTSSTSLAFSLAKQFVYSALLFPSLLAYYEPVTWEVNTPKSVVTNNVLRQLFPICFRTVRSDPKCLLCLTISCTYDKSNMLYLKSNWFQVLELCPINVTQIIHEYGWIFIAIFSDAVFITLLLLLTAKSQLSQE